MNSIFMRNKRESRGIECCCVRIVQEFHRECPSKRPPLHRGCWIPMFHWISMVRYLEISRYLRYVGLDLAALSVTRAFQLHCEVSYQCTLTLPTNNRAVDTVLRHQYAMRPRFLLLCYRRRSKAKIGRVWSIRSWNNLHPFSDLQPNSTMGEIFV